MGATAMVQITLTSDQTQLLASATDGVVIADSAGNVIAQIPPKISEEEAAIVAEAKRRLASDQPRIPYSEVLQRIKELEKQGVATPSR